LSTIENINIIAATISVATIISGLWMVVTNTVKKES